MSESVAIVKGDKLRRSWSAQKNYKRLNKK